VRVVHGKAALKQASVRHSGTNKTFISGSSSPHHQGCCHLPNQCVVHGKSALKQASARHQALTSIYFGLIFTASSRLLAPTKSVTQARRQFGRYLLFHIAMQALHPTGKEYDIAYWLLETQSISSMCAVFLPF
jgi:hypothetical protein